MKKIIIYGAGKWGKRALQFYNDKMDVLFVVDGDSRKWINDCGNGIKIVPPQTLEKYKDIPIIVAVKEREAIIKYLKSIGCSHISFFPEIWIHQYAGEMDSIIRELKENRSIDLGGFLLQLGEIKLPELTYLPGGSGTLDYAFIRGIVQKYRCESYLEIGTYIGESINVVADLCKVCHSITAEPGKENSMLLYCKTADIPDYTERLCYADNIVHHYCEDSAKFNYKSIRDSIDVYFIDADHFYSAVYEDTKNVFLHRKEDSFVIWHDFKGSSSCYGTVLAVKDVLGEDFLNVYCVDNNLCGIYIPKKYQNDFKLRKCEYTDKKQSLYVYDTALKVKVK